MGMEAVVLAAGGVSDADVVKWRALADRAIEGNPFFRPEFVLAAPLARPSPIELLVVRDQGEWLACLPVSRAPRWRHVVLPCLGPWLEPYALLGQPLLDRDHAGTAAQALAGLLRRERRAAALVLDRVDPDGPATRYVLEAVERGGTTPIVYREYERAQLYRRPRNTYLEEAVSKSGRDRIRRKARQLGRELGGDVTLVDRADDPDAWDEFLTLEASGWKGELGTALGSRAGDAEFFRSVCSGMAATGHLQVLSLEVGGKTVAMQCNLVERDRAYAFKVAYDETFAKLSPGVALHLEIMELFHDEMTVVGYDSCAAPDSALFNRIWPDRRHIQLLVVPTGAPLGRLVSPLLKGDTIGRRWRGHLREWWQERRGQGGDGPPEAPGPHGTSAREAARRLRARARRPLTRTPA
jgi:CelD/BcsL family acetyltransferase involved in cellulose biosynthesis